MSSRETVVRVTGLPASTTEDAERLLKDVISNNLSVEEAQKFEYKVSIVPSCANEDSTLVALVDFYDGIPSFLASLREDSIGEYQIEINSGKDDISFDRHFHGFTQLYPVDESSPITMDIIAICGIDGHAYESWRGARVLRRMWLRHFLSKDMPRCRTMIYGYSADLSVYGTATVEDYTTEFLEQLKTIRGGQETSQRLVVFITHSFGGIILARALVKAMFSYESDHVAIFNLKRVITAILFFAVPHRGIDITDMSAILDSEQHPRAGLLGEIATDSTDLVKQLEFFKESIRNVKIVSFYETEQSRRLQKNEQGEWCRTGPYLTTLEKDRAILQLPTQIETRIPVHKSHSAIVKFEARAIAPYTLVIENLKFFEKSAYGTDTACTIKMPAAMQAGSDHKHVEDNSNRVGAQFAELAITDNRPAAKSPDAMFRMIELLSSISKGDLRSVQRRLSAGIDINKPTKDGRTPLGVAVTSGNEDVVTYLLDQGAKVDMLHRTSPPLCWAAVKGHTGIVRTLLAYNAKIDAPGHNDARALHHAAISGHVAVLAILLNYKADVTARDKDGYNAFEVALMNGQKLCARELIAHPASFNNRYQEGRTALHLAIVHKKEDMALNIIRRCPNLINIADDKGVTPLIEAIYNDQAAIFSALLQAGAKSSYFQGGTLLQYCVLWDRIQYITPLLNHGVHVDEREDETKSTPFQLAARYGSLKIARLLHNAGASIENPVPAAPLHEAAKNGRVDFTRYLLSLDVNPNVQAVNDDSTQAIHVAAFGGHNDVIRELLRHGVYVDVGAKFGKTALMFAAEYDKLETVRLLVHCGASLEETETKHDLTALELAAGRGCFRIVEFLISSGANFERANKDGNTPVLHVCTRNKPVDRLKTLQLLWENGASLHAMNKDGDNVCHLAAWNGFVDCLPWLLSVMGMLESRSRSGETPLHSAAYSVRLASLKSMQICIERGADIHAVTKDGQTPLHFASTPEKIRLLVKHGANIREQTDCGGLLHYAIARSDIDDIEAIEARLQCDASVHLLDQ